jgi:menaquinone-dependent protoporphyrinogen IX oxidase
MTEFETKAVIDKINRMFRERCFSICDVDSLMQVTGATRNADYRALQLYHCVHYDEMDEKTKQFVYKATLENVTNINAFPMLKLFDPVEEMEKLAVENAPVSNGFLKTLLGRVAK